jgi:hypothetical protein
MKGMREMRGLRCFQWETFTALTSFTFLMSRLL